jgi:hypothetical protein
MKLPPFPNLNDHTLKEIRQQSGASLDLKKDRRTLRLSGSEAQVKKADQLVQQKVTCTAPAHAWQEKSLWLPLVDSKRLMGAGGKNFQKFQEKNNLWLKLDKDEDTKWSRLQIFGSPENVARALQDDYFKDAWHKDPNDIVTSEHKCKSPSCNYRPNTDPEYRRIKKQHLWPYCCNSCFASDGKEHGRLCGKHASDGEAADDTPVVASDKKPAQPLDDKPRLRAIGMTNSQTTHLRPEALNQIENRVDNAYGTPRERLNKIVPEWVSQNAPPERVNEILAVRVACDFCSGKSAEATCRHISFQEKRPGGALISARDLASDGHECPPAGTGPFLLPTKVVCVQRGLTGKFQSFLRNPLVKSNLDYERCVMDMVGKVLRQVVFYCERRMQQKDTALHQHWMQYGKRKEIDRRSSELSHDPTVLITAIRTLLNADQDYAEALFGIGIRKDDTTWAALVALKNTRNDISHGQHIAPAKMDSSTSVRSIPRTEACFMAALTLTKTLGDKLVRCDEPTARCDEPTTAAISEADSGLRSMHCEFGEHRMMVERERIMCKHLTDDDSVALARYALRHAQECIDKGGADAERWAKFVCVALAERVNVEKEQQEEEEEEEELSIQNFDPFLVEGGAVDGVTARGLGGQHQLQQRVPGAADWLARMLELARANPDGRVDESAKIQVLQARRRAEYMHLHLGRPITNAAPTSVIPILPPAVTTGLARWKAKALERRPRAQTQALSKGRARELWRNEPDLADLQPTVILRSASSPEAHAPRSGLDGGGNADDDGWFYLASPQKRAGLSMPSRSTSGGLPTRSVR